MHRFLWVVVGAGLLFWMSWPRDLAAQYRMINPLVTADTIPRAKWHLPQGTGWVQLGIDTEPRLTIEPDTSTASEAAVVNRTVLGAVIGAAVVAGLLFADCGIFCQREKVYLFVPVGAAMGAVVGYMWDHESPESEVP